MRALILKIDWQEYIVLKRKTSKSRLYAVTIIILWTFNEPTFSGNTRILRQTRRHNFLLQGIIPLHNVLVPISIKKQNQCQGKE